MTTIGPAEGPTAEVRGAATRRPGDWTIMRHRWAHLLFLHWAVPIEQLRPLVPSGLDLDLFDGRAYVGLIPFTMTGVRPVGTPPIPGFSGAHEVNVRTYVHRAGRDPGVWFFSLDINHRLARWGARTFFHLPYYDARMELNVRDGASPRIDYASERVGWGPRPARCRLGYDVEGRPAPAAAGTLEHFLIERYILYAEAAGRLYRGRVYHESYPVQPARLLALEESMVAAAGIARPDEPPLVHYASEVRVRVYPLRRVG